jgi:hypothetical protein
MTGRFLSALRHVLASDAVYLCVVALVLTAGGCHG